MRSLTTTLHTLLNAADANFDSGRLSTARANYELLLERAQETRDRSMETVARSMLAHVALRRRAFDEAESQRVEAFEVLLPSDPFSLGRYRKVEVRLAMVESDAEAVGETLHEYLDWAEREAVDEYVLDAVKLLVERPNCSDEHEGFLEQGVDAAERLRDGKSLVDLLTRLGALLDQQGRVEEALTAYERGLVAARLWRRGRSVVALLWAVGAVALRAEEYDKADRCLKDALVLASERDDCSDLEALSLADFAQLRALSGDVVEARRLMIRSLKIARDEHFAVFWPDRWRSLQAYGAHLEVL